MLNTRPSTLVYHALSATMDTTTFATGNVKHGVPIATVCTVRSIIFVRSRIAIRVRTGRPRAATTGSRIVASGEPFCRAASRWYHPKSTSTSVIYDRKIIQPEWINPAQRIATHIAIKIAISTLKQNRILGRPPPRLSIVVPRSEPRQPRIRVVQPARIPERLEARVGVQRDLAPRVRHQIV